jgi:hypothetical protein
MLHWCLGVAIKANPLRSGGAKPMGLLKHAGGEEVARLSNGVGGGATKRSAIPTVSNKQEAGHISPTQAKRLDTPATVATMCTWETNNPKCRGLEARHQQLGA